MKKSKTYLRTRLASAAKFLLFINALFVFITIKQGFPAVFTHNDILTFNSAPLISSSWNPRINALGAGKIGTVYIDAGENLVTDASFESPLPLRAKPIDAIYYVEKIKVWENGNPHVCSVNNWEQIQATGLTTLSEAMNTDVRLGFKIIAPANGGELDLDQAGVFEGNSIPSTGYRWH